MPRLSRVALLAFVTVLAACSGGRRGAAPSRTGTPPGMSGTASAPSTHTGGGVSFAGRDLPVSQLHAQIRSSGRPGLLYFTTSWCGFCRLLESETLSRPEVAAHVAGYTNVAYNADGGVGRELATKYGITGFPTIVRIDASGNRTGFNEGYDPPAGFLQRIPKQ